MPLARVPALALLLLAAAATARPNAADKFWCEPPLFCEPAAGPDLVPPTQNNLITRHQRNLAVNASGDGGGFYSRLWGKQGEEWSPTSRMMDFSYAGYRMGEEPIPSPPVTKSYEDFRKIGMSDTDALRAALDWAHKQPMEDWVVIGIPEGEHVIDRQLHIRRPRLVLRGEGSGTTILKVKRPLKDVPSAPRPPDGLGYFNKEAFVMFDGEYLRGPSVATVTARAPRGTRKLKVSSLSKLRVGQYVAVVLSDRKGALTKHLLGNQGLDTGTTTINRDSVVRFVSRIIEVDKAASVIKLERYLPFMVHPDFLPVIKLRTGSLYDSGIEGVTFQFPWAKYGGHHYEDGYNAVQFMEVYDCWASDIRTINADNGIFIHKSGSVQVNNLRMQQTKPRDPMKPKSLGDGHWGVLHGGSTDLLVDGFDIRPNLLHCVGSDAMGMYAVFMNGHMKNGNLELHKALSGPALFTSIAVGIGDHAFQSGGPQKSGANTQAGTVYWNIRADGGRGMPPPGSNTAKVGSCDFGPDLTFVATRLSGKFCKDWYYELGSGPVTPFNLYQAMYDRRHAKATP